MASNRLEMTFSSQNKLIQMNKSSEFKILEVEGLEASAYSINKTDSNQDGAIITYRKIEPREIVIKGDIQKNANENNNRNKIINFFNPKFDGILKVFRNGTERKISYVVSSFKFINKKMSEFTQFQIILECVNPYFESVDDFGNNVASISKQFAFPLVIPSGIGKMMGYKTFNENVVLVNDGDCETGAEIHIKAKGGKVVNPKISLNDTFIALNLEMVDGDTLIINTNQRKKSITLNGENVVQKIDRKSTFFNLNVGTNVLKYESDEGYSYMEVYVYFYKKYLGV